MSIWSHVHGIVEVDTFGQTNAEAMYFAQTVVDHLPRIDGSEGPVEYYLNLKNGYNCSSNADENRKFTNLYTSSSYFRSIEHQSCVIITLQGDLRDCTFEETLKRTTTVLNRLSRHLFVRGCSVTVCSLDRQYTFANPSWMMFRQDDTPWPHNLIRRPWDKRKEDEKDEDSIKF